MHRDDLICSDAAAAVPSDSAYVNFDGLYVGATGNVTVVTGKGNTVTFPAVPAGAILPLKITQVKATGTTATSMVGFIP